MQDRKQTMRLVTFVEVSIPDGLFYFQEVPTGNKDSAGGPWEFVGLLPLFDPPRHDSAETIRRALHLGVSVKMITGRCV